MEQPTERRGATTTPAPARLLAAPETYPRPDGSRQVRAWVLFAPPDAQRGRAGVLVFQEPDAVAFLRTNPTRSEAAGGVADLVPMILRAAWEEGATAAEAVAWVRRVSPNVPAWVFLGAPVEKVRYATALRLARS